MTSRNVIASWSGGKDCCLAVHCAMQEGCRVEALLNFVAQATNRACFHGVPSDLMRRQADLMGIQLVQPPVPEGDGQYEIAFKKAVAEFTPRGVAAMVFGDIYLDEHKEWVDRVCGDLGIEALEPLWNSDPETLMHTFIDAGFKAVVISAKEHLFDSRFMGRLVDRDLVAELVARGICPCGEHGEFHTLVVDGPLFSKPIRITASEPVLKDGFWKHWSLDIKEYDVG